MKLVIDRDSRGFETKEFREYLKTPCPKTEITQQEADQLREQLEQGLKQHPGLGISATQLGIKKRACLIQFGDEELFLLNPVIKEKSNEGFLFYEGCLSIPRTLEKPIRTIRACKVVIDTDNVGEMTFEINRQLGHLAKSNQMNSAYLRVLNKLNEFELAKEIEAQIASSK